MPHLDDRVAVLREVEHEERLEREVGVAVDAKAEYRRELGPVPRLQPADVSPSAITIQAITIQAIIIQAITI